MDPQQDDIFQDLDVTWHEERNALGCLNSVSFVKQRSLFARVCISWT